MPNYNYSAVQWGTNTFTVLSLDPGIQYRLSVQAIDLNQNASGYGSDTLVTAALDTIPPSKPAAPVVAGSALAILVQHSLGRDSGGTFNLEADLDHLNVYYDTSPGFSPSDSTLLGQIPATAGNLNLGIKVIGVFQVTDDTERYVAVTAVDRAGNESTMSSEATVTAELIDTAYIAEAAIGTANIQDLAVTNAKISDLSVTKLTAGIISAGDITVSSVLKASSYVPGTSGWKLDGAGAELNVGVVINAPLSADQITTGSLDADRISSGTITGDHIAGTTITGGNIVTGTIQAAQIGSGAVITDKLFANAVTADKIAANTITASQLVVGSSDNLIQNPSFEQGVGTELTPYYIDNAGASTGWYRIQTTAAHSGTMLAALQPRRIAERCWLLSIRWGRSGKLIWSPGRTPPMGSLRTTLPLVSATSSISLFGLYRTVMVVGQGSTGSAPG